MKSEAKIVVQEVEDTQKKSLQLLMAYNQANETLENRVKNSKTTRSSSQYLLEKASQLSTNTILKLKELGGNALNFIKFLLL